jgi:uncharacterized protein (DUF1800 family)
MPTGADERAAVAHLVRRAAFGAPAATIDELADRGYEAAVDVLCSFDAADPGADAIAPPTFDTAGYLAARDGDQEARQAAAKQARTERRALPLWWLRRMVAADQPAREKLTFLWHDHFATSIEKVKLAELLFRQRQTLYALGADRFDELVHAIARDPAMLIWLDGRENTKAAPNENFARELLELFTLGHPGHEAAGAYDEHDVAEAARSLTGWRIDRASGVGVLDPRRHDRGTKAVLGRTGDLGLDDVVAAATTHPACAPHVVARLWSRLARPAAPDDPVVIELAASFARDLDVAGLFRRMLLHPAFRDDTARVALVRTPVDLVVGTYRALRLEPDASTIAVLFGLGQLPFLPPDVSGWPANEAWLSTATARVRLEWAVGVAARVDPSVLDIEADRPAGLARLLGIASWTTETADALDAATDPRQALALALVAPEHLVA